MSVRNSESTQKQATVREDDLSSDLESIAVRQIPRVVILIVQGYYIT